MSNVCSTRERALLVLVALLFGLVSAQVGGILTVVGGGQVATAFLTGGVTFAGAVTLALAVEKALGYL